MDGYNGPLKQALTTGTGFSPIGSQDLTNAFYGTFDGDNKAICSLYINIDNDKGGNIGLFTSTYGEIRNVGLVNINVNAIIGNSWTPVGGLVATGHSNIYNSYVTGSINVTGSYWMPVGGLCGQMNEKVNIENCYNLANINATNIKEGWGSADIGCGGILGQGKANINKCYNGGNITANGGDNYVGVGGICGQLNDGYIKNSYNNAEIEGIGNQKQGESYIGGITASTYNDITNCYNLGKVIGNIYGARIGGIIGNQRGNGTISNIFNMGQIQIENEDVYAVGGIIGLVSGSGEYHANINNAYNTGKISIEMPKSYIGSIAASNWANVMTYNNCCYLAGTYEVGVGGSGASVGVTELDDISKFPSVLEVVNDEGAFKEDTAGINNGYPILDWQ